MAKVAKIHYVDDLTGEEIESADLRVIRFAVDGEEFQIETTPAGAAEFYEVLEGYTTRATRIGGRRNRISPRPAVHGMNFSDIRAWAKENGHRVSDRGRVPVAIIEAYNAAH